MNPLKKIARISCKQAALLGTKASFNALNLFEKIKLKMHTKVCVTCCDYQKNSEFIDQAVEKTIRQNEQQQHTLTQKQRNKIIEALR
jgi:hypothetical protein